MVAAAVTGDFGYPGGGRRKCKISRDTLGVFIPFPH